VSHDDVGENSAGRQRSAGTGQDVCVLRSRSVGRFHCVFLHANVNVNVNLYSANNRRSNLRRWRVGD